MILRINIFFRGSVFNYVDVFYRLFRNLKLFSGWVVIKIIFRYNIWKWVIVVVFLLFVVYISVGVRDIEIVFFYNGF